MFNPIATPDASLGGDEYMISATAKKAVIRMRPRGAAHYKTIAHGARVDVEQALEDYGWSAYNRSPWIIANIAKAFSVYAGPHSRFHPHRARPGAGHRVRRRVPHPRWCSVSTRDPATAVFEWLIADWEAIRLGMISAGEDLAVFYATREKYVYAYMDVQDAVRGLTGPKACLAALLECPNAAVRLAAQLTLDGVKP